VISKIRKPGDRLRFLPHTAKKFSDLYTLTTEI